MGSVLCTEDSLSRNEMICLNSEFSALEDTPWDQVVTVTSIKPLLDDESQVFGVEARVSVAQRTVANAASVVVDIVLNSRAPRNVKRHPPR